MAIGTEDGPFGVFALILSLMCQVKDESLGVFHILTMSRLPLSRSETTYAGAILYFEERHSHALSITPVMEIDASPTISGPSIQHGSYENLVP